jgi:hypothetical protein
MPHPMWLEEGFGVAERSAKGTEAPKKGHPAQHTQCEDGRSRRVFDEMEDGADDDQRHGERIGY